MVRRQNASPDSTEPPMKTMAHTSSPPHPLEKQATNEEASIARTRVAALIAAGLLMVGVILAATFLSSVTPRWGELVKIIAVVMFVGSMIALALGMVGDAFRRR